MRHAARPDTALERIARNNKGYGVQQERWILPAESNWKEARRVAD